MKIYIDRAEGDEAIRLMATAESDEAIGDAFWTVLPGETVLGKTYDEWEATDSPFELTSMPEESKL